MRVEAGFGLNLVLVSTLFVIIPVDEDRHQSVLPFCGFQSIGQECRKGNDISDNGDLQIEY